jgi:hypothetical protein
MSLLGLHIKIDNESWLKTKVFKRDVFKLPRQNFSFTFSNISMAPACGVIHFSFGTISQSY